MHALLLYYSHNMSGFSCKGMDFSGEFRHFDLLLESVDTGLDDFSILSVQRDDIAIPFIPAWAAFGKDLVSQKGFFFIEDLKASDGHILGHGPFDPLDIADVVHMVVDIYIIVIGVGDPEHGKILR